MYNDYFSPVYPSGEHGTWHEILVLNKPYGWVPEAIVSAFLAGILSEQELLRVCQPLPQNVRWKKKTYIDRARYN